jgi:hypothetical protein
MAQRRKESDFYFNPGIRCVCPERRGHAVIVAASALALKSGLIYFPCMSSVQEIETAVSKLSRQELLAFRNWFSEFDAAAWDKQFEEDIAAGHLDALAEEALRDLREGRCRDLSGIAPARSSGSSIRNFPRRFSGLRS